MAFAATMRPSAADATLFRAIARWYLVRTFVALADAVQDVAADRADLEVVSAVREG